MLTQPGELRHTHAHARVCKLQKKPLVWRRIHRGALTQHGELRQCELQKPLVGRRMHRGALTQHGELRQCELQQPLVGRQMHRGAGRRLDREERRVADAQHAAFLRYAEEAAAKIDLFIRTRRRFNSARPLEYACEIALIERDLDARLRELLPLILSDDYGGALDILKWYDDDFAMACIIYCPLSVDSATQI
ncbi:hypothetical protein T492DRAFT_888565 [Pavlovales sp. CCMP2436]|nr:hypothetical protein T492DRAFT_888565 [Pavlovales sp. CCMP2436]